MKKFICLLLTILLLLPFTAGCTTGLQGDVTATVIYLDGSKVTVKGHRRYGEETDSESIFYKLSDCLKSSQGPEVGKSTYFVLEDGNYFIEDHLYQLDNGAKITLTETQRLNKYKVAYHSQCPELYDTKYYEKTYTFGDKIELLPEIQDLLTFDNPTENFDRYNFVGWEIFYTDEKGKEITYEYVFNENFDAKYHEYYEKANVPYLDYYNTYYMKVRAIWKANTYNAVLNFEHEGVKQLTTPVEPATYTSNFNATGYGKSTFETHVKEANVEFVGFSTDKFTYVPLPAQIDKSQDGTNIQLYAIWYRYKTIKVDFLNGDGPIGVRVYEDRYPQYFNINPYYLSKYLTSEQYNGFIGLSDNRDGTSRIIKTYEVCNENTIYYPVIA